MRVTNSMLGSNVLENISGNLGRLLEIQKKISSGKNFTCMSDDPLNASKDLRIKEQLSDNVQYSANLTAVKPFMEIADAQLFDITNVIAQAKNYALQGMNGTESAESRALLASNLEEMIGSLINYGNITYNGQYIFGGYNTETPPFELSGDKVYYNGTTDSIQTEIGKGEILNSTMAGNEIFITHCVEGTPQILDKTVRIFPQPDSDTFSITVGSSPLVNITVPGPDYSLDDVVNAINTSGAEVIARAVKTGDYYSLQINSKIVGEQGTMVLNDVGVLPGDQGVLESLGLIDNTGNIVGNQTDPTAGTLDALLELKTLLENNSAASRYSDVIVKINKGYDQVVSTHGKVGMEEQRAQIKEGVLAKAKENLQNFLSTVEDIDYAEMITKMNQENQAYQASLKIGAQIQQISLLDFI